MMKKMISQITGWALLTLVSLLSFSSYATETAALTTHGNIEQVLKSFHKAAANADSKTYFSLLTTDAVFLGTDATERWEKPAFKAFVEPYFGEGNGWTYIPTEQNISLSQDGKTAFFDELLLSESYGQCRGSGMLRLTAHGWKIAQYNLSIPLPNALAKDVVATIAEHKKEGVQPVLNAN
jgi:ketosteroid isomerase-like protein